MSGRLGDFGLISGYFSRSYRPDVDVYLGHFLSNPVRR